jgi:para-nitrobenzyl esterase
LDLADVNPTGPWEDAGTAGMLDLVLALKWVRDNIDRFGGDPDCVTIFGQSGGGWKVSTLLKMPSASGLFHRAVVQSGSLATHFPREVAAQMAHAFIAKLGVTPATLETMQRMPWTQLLAAQTAIGAHAFAPFVDGRNIPAQPMESLPDSHCAAVPLIIGTTLDDAGLFFDRFDMTDPELIDVLSLSYGAKAKAMHALYREYFPAKSAYLLHAQIITDAGFRRFARMQAEHESTRPGASVYSYLWEWQSPAYDGKFGAVHAMDVAASMHNERDAILGSGSTDAHRACEELALALLAFAQTGNPNHRRLPNWPRFEARSGATLVLDRHSRVEDDPHAALRAFWLDMPPSASVLG